jgi:NAD-dependent deacetylase
MLNRLRVLGEAIPEPARSQAFLAAEETDVMLVIGTTGQVMPACLVPWVARRAGAEVIEVNPQTSEFTGRVSTVFLQDTASLALNRLKEMLK